MKLFFVITSLSMFFWIFPAVRQYKTELFWYFLVFAFADPLSIIITTQIHYVSNIPRTQIFFSFLLMLSVLWSFKSKKSIKIFTASVLSLVLFSLFSNRTLAYSLLILIHVIITFFFIKRTFAFTANSGKVNIFHLILLLEEISIVLKTSTMLISFNPGYSYYIATNAFEILIAIFFTLYKEENEKLFIDLRSA
ncbi:MAG: hypothetical protein ACYC4T_07780 [Melioribacteraceae bacterium]